ncbi:YkvI family membrane protein [Pseudobacillus badius]|uniref:YkvI family membrane protein n=1 Tax=Bacillus badius TaxID=1455 RepID=UPI0024A21187|nr:hypothetical protein [Bacillus badius]MED0667096.1 hypothetical protein [Bacillus badius]GLY10711.1 membrane protein [Bacillus badius]
MTNAFKIAGAYIGVIVGAGFASGQEILQFFTSFGWISVVGTCIATVLFAFLGMQLLQIGSRIGADSHKNVIYLICGKWIGLFVDALITFFLFGVAAVMIAGSGAIFEQQFGIDALYGSLIMAGVTAVTLCFNLQKIISVISLITPFLFIMIFIVFIYSILQYKGDVSEIMQLGKSGQTAASHWMTGAVLYVSYNIAAGAAILALIGGAEKNEKTAGIGGLFGGLGLGLLILLINVIMLLDFGAIQEADMPIVHIANEISPIAGYLMSLVLLAMIYNTSVGMIYAFAARVVPSGGKSFTPVVIISAAAAFLASFVGFVKLVGTLYPLVGYLGLILIVSIIFVWFKFKQSIKHEIHISS